MCLLLYLAHRAAASRSDWQAFQRADIVHSSGLHYALNQATLSPYLAVKDTRHVFETLHLVERLHNWRAL